MSEAKIQELEPLSQTLRNMVRDEDEDYLTVVPDQEKEAMLEADRLMREFIKKFLRSIEGFGDSPPSSKAPRAGDSPLLEYLLDNRYTRLMLERIPKMVRRTMKLSHIFTRIMPSQATDLYLREATRSYIYGFWQASVALSRAALEQGLRERLDKDSADSSGELHVVIERAYKVGLLDLPHRGMADSVRLVGNHVLHRGKRAAEEEAWDALCQARGILVRLFGEG